MVDLSRTQLDQDEGETKQEHSPVAALVAAARTGRWDESSGSAAPAAVLTPDQLLRTEDVWSLVSGPTPGHYRVVREGIEDSLRRIVLSTEERAGLSPEAAAEADQKTLESLQRLHRRLGRFLSDNGSK